MASTSNADPNFNLLMDDELILQLLDESDIEELEDEDDGDISQVPVLEPVLPPADDSSDEEIDECPSPPHSNTPLIERIQDRTRWRHKEWTDPQLETGQEDDQVPDLLNPGQYFEKYFPDDFIQQVSGFTNQYCLQETGKVLGTSPSEIKKLIGAHIIMGTICYPRIRMYWDRTYNLPLISESMTRDRFFSLRVNLHFVDNNAVTEEEKKNRLWKVQPIISTVRSACRAIPRTERDYSVDEQMIPFTGRCSLKQYVKNKPRPVGLKNFVCTTSKGLVVDFEVYQGKSTPMQDTGLGLGPNVVLHLVQTLPLNSMLYFDRYFTTIPLLDALKRKGIYGTGTIMTNRVKKVNFKPDRTMVRGEAEEICRHDDEVCLIRWKDSKVVTMASTVHGKQPEVEVRRWEKKEKRLINISCPNSVKKYNEKMGGVDICDQQMEAYRTFFKTKKWTLKTAIHFIDLATVNSWMEYREAAKKNQIPRKQIHDLLSFRLALGEKLLQSTDSTPFQEDSDEEDMCPPAKKMCSALPCHEKKTDGFHHWPTMDKIPDPLMCRFQGCTSRAKNRCKKCNVYLCHSTKKHCFENFHIGVAVE